VAGTRHRRSSSVPAQVETVIIFRIGHIGDTAAALPCFHRIARSFASSRRLLLTNIPASQKAAPVESVLANSGLIDDVIYFPPPPRTLRSFVKLREEIRATKSQALVYVADRNLLATLRDVCFFRACGIRSIIGAPISSDLRRPRVDPTTGFVEFEAERLARCLARLGPIDLHDPDFWDLRLQRHEMRAAEQSLAPIRQFEFIAVSVGGKVASKDWGDDNWMTLLALMALRYSHLALVFFGSADEFDRSSMLAAAWPGPRLNLCGRLVPRESAAAMRSALLFVGHDSGPLHLAAVAGVPCVGIFGNYNRPKWWHPMGQRHRIIHNMRGVRHIAPEEVCVAIGSLASEAATQGSRHVSGAGA
jgi:heptosyltransferase-3